ncbi:MAG: metal ABC transporter permease [Planctomycetes bacterium]|nr:metal ABC transporter permease [Planctomycetota bacterium]MBL7146094.1 metal ABC transporter permease [Phycisphaerae bacterium]
MSEVIKLFSLQIALIAVVLVLHTYLGLHIIRRTLIFSDLVLDQLAAFGALVGVGIYTKFAFSDSNVLAKLAVHFKYASVGSYLLALIAVLFGSLLLALIKPKTRAIPREAVICIFFAMALVISLLLTDKLPNAETYVSTTLSGSLLWVTWPLVIVTAFVYIVLLIFHYILRDKFITLAENPQTLQNEKLWDFLFFTTQGIITVLIVPIAGVLLAYAFLMIPAATAAMFTKKWAKAVLIGWSTGFVACVLGLGSSYLWNFPYGPTLVLFLGLFFVCAMILQCLLSRRNLNSKG